jgi:hypothetical protein
MSRCAVVLVDWEDLATIKHQELQREMGWASNRALAIHHKMDDLFARGTDFSNLSNCTSPSRVGENTSFLRRILVAQSSEHRHFKGFAGQH